MIRDLQAMAEPVIDLESAAAKREAAKPAAALPALRADPDLNLTAEIAGTAVRPPVLAVVPKEPVLDLPAARPAAPPAEPIIPWKPPVLGCLAVIFGISALFKATLLLAPLALFFALLAALFRQFSWAAIGGMSGLAALATSPWFWGIVGLTWLADAVAGYFGLSIGSWYSSFF
jgi:hypothetical protein